MSAAADAPPFSLLTYSGLFHQGASWRRLSAAALPEVIAALANGAGCSTIFSRTATCARMLLHRPDAVGPPGVVRDGKPFTAGQLAKIQGELGQAGFLSFITAASPPTAAMPASGVASARFFRQCSLRRDPADPGQWQISQVAHRDETLDDSVPAAPHDAKSRTIPTAAEGGSAGERDRAGSRPLLLPSLQPRGLDVPEAPADAEIAPRTRVTLEDVLPSPTHSAAPTSSEMQLCADPAPASTPSLAPPAGTGSGMDLCSAGSGIPLCSAGSGIKLCSAPAVAFGVHPLPPDPATFFAPSGGLPVPAGGRSPAAAQAPEGLLAAVSRLSDRDPFCTRPQPGAGQAGRPHSGPPSHPPDPAALGGAEAAHLSAAVGGPGLGSASAAVGGPGLDSAAFDGAPLPCPGGVLSTILEVPDAPASAPFTVAADAATPLHASAPAAFPIPASTPASPPRVAAATTPASPAAFPAPLTASSEPSAPSAVTPSPASPPAHASTRGPQDGGEAKEQGPDQKAGPQPVPHFSAPPPRTGPVGARRDAPPRGLRRSATRASGGLGPAGDERRAETPDVAVQFHQFSFASAGDLQPQPPAPAPARPRPPVTARRPTKAHPQVPNSPPVPNPAQRAGTDAEEPAKASKRGPRTNKRRINP
jgi:hypothetical protein